MGLITKILKCLKNTSLQNISRGKRYYFLFMGNRTVVEAQGFVQGDTKGMTQTRNELEFVGFPSRVWNSTTDLSLQQNSSSFFFIISSKSIILIKIVYSVSRKTSAFTGSDLMHSYHSSKRLSKLVSHSLPFWKGFAEILFSLHLYSKRGHS